MATLEELVETFIGNTDKANRESTISDIIDTINNKSTILPLILVLGKFLTSSTSNIQRQDSILIIYKVLNECNNLQLNVSDLSTIITFLCSRFEYDLQCQPFIILALCVLYNKYHDTLSSHNSSELLIKIIATIINKLDYEQIKLKVRYSNGPININYNQLCREQYLKVLHHALNHYTDIMQNKLTSDELFIDGAIKIIDGESDPRNILLSFNLYQSLFQHYTHHILSKHIQNLFEIMEVYFPIEFNAPSAKKDVFGITKEDLNNGLNACFACNSLLSSFVLNMILEKLDSDETAADKQQAIDIMLCLKYCCNAYGANIIQSYLREIYDKTKAFILYGNDKDVHDVVLELIASLVCLICEQSTSNIGYYNADNDGKENTDIDHVDFIGWTTFIEPFINDFRAEIKIPDAKLARLSSEIIISISSACFKSFNVVLKHLWNDLMTKYEATKANKELISQKHALLEVMSSIWIPLKNIKGTEVKQVDRNMCYSLFLSTVMEHNDIASKCIAMITLSYLCDITSLLSKTEITQIVSVIYAEFEIITKQISRITNDEKEFKKLMDYKEIMYNAMSRIAKHSSDVVLDLFMNGILKYLDIESKKMDINIDTLRVLLDLMAPLCLDNDYILHYVLKIVLHPLYSLLSTPKNVTSCFHKICIMLDHNNCTFDDALIDGFLTQIITQFEWKLGNTKDEYELCLVINDTISKMIARSSHEIQIKFAKYCVNDISKLENNSTMNRYKLWIELTCIASCDSLDDVLSVKVLIHLQTLLLSLSYDSGYDKKIMNYYFECVACILNKCKSNDIIAAYLHCKDFEYLWNDTKVDKHKSFHLYYVIFIIKALCVRCYRDKEQHTLQQLIASLCKCLLSENKRISQIASCGFDIIMNDKAMLILNKKNKCKISSLYKQKFFIQTIEYILKELAPSNTSISNEEQIYLLFAVCHLMKNVPNAVLSSHLSQLLPLMIESFKSSQASLRISILYLFEVLFQSNLQCVIPFVDIIIPILLQLTKYRKDVKVRISALRCLLCLSNLEYKEVHSMVRKVIRLLSDAVDDNKKEVRAIAVHCRNKWYLLQSS